MVETDSSGRGGWGDAGKENTIGCPILPPGISDDGPEGIKADFDSFVYHHSMTRGATFIILTALLATLWSCMADPSSNVGFNEPDPQARIRAATKAGAERDRSAIPELIGMLDSDDPAERFVAIHTLQSFNDGDSLGYRHSDERADRTAAIDRWEEWSKSSSPNK